MSENPSPPAFMSRWRELAGVWAPRAAFESLLIVFSILLALTLNGWIADINAKERVQEARAYLIAEIRANRALLASDEYLPHHTELLHRLEHATRGPISSLADAEPVFEQIQTGVHFTPLRDAVWRSFSSSDVLAHMPPEDVFALNDVYQAQEQVRSIHQGFYPVLAQLPVQFTKGGDVSAPLMQLRLYMADVVGGEQTITARYDAALARLDADTR